MQNSVEIWENEVYRSKRQKCKNYLLSGTSLEGLKGRLNFAHGLNQYTLTLDKYTIYYALACPVRNINGV